MVLYSARLVARQVRLCIMYGLQQPLRVRWVEIISALVFIVVVVLVVMLLPKEWAVLEEIEPDL